MKKGTILLYLGIFSLGYMAETPSAERAIMLLGLGLLGLISLMLPLWKWFDQRPTFKLLVLALSPVAIFLLEQQSRYSINDYFQMLYFVLLVGIYQYGQNKLFQMVAALSLAGLSWKYIYIMRVNADLIKPPQLVVAISLYGLVALILWLGLKLNQEKSYALLLNLQLEERQEKLEKTNLQLARVMDELEALTVYRERQKMAREIHDTVGHELTALTMKLEMCRHYATTDPKQMAQILEESIDDSRTAIKLTRQVVETLTTTRRSPEDFLQLLNRYEGGLTFQIHWTGVEHLQILNTEQSHVAYRMVQEAITNCMKHSRASQLSIDISKGTETILVNISDDGNVHPPIREGFGLKGMRERAEEVGGQFTYFTDEGFHLTMALPYGEERIL